MQIAHCLVMRPRAILVRVVLVSILVSIVLSLLLYALASSASAQGLRGSGSIGRQDNLVARPIEPDILVSFQGSVRSLRACQPGRGLALAYLLLRDAGEP